MTSADLTAVTDWTADGHESAYPCGEGLGRTAFLLSGLQHDFCSEHGALAALGADLTAVQAALPQVQRVLTAVRTAGLLVIHLPEQALRGGMSDSHAWQDQRARNGWRHAIAAEGGWGEGFVEGFGPERGEPVVHRHRPGGLYDTRASVLLRSAGVAQVILAGVETHRTILATAIQAACLDYRVVIPAQAVASTEPVLGPAAIQSLGSWARLLDVDDLLHELQAPESRKRSDRGTDARSAVGK